MIKVYKGFQQKGIINCFIKRNVSSYLYVTGDKAREIYSSIQPYIDFDKRIESINKLDENIKKRKIDLNIHELKNSWDFYNTRLDYKQKLETNWKEIKVTLDKLLTNNTNGSNDIEIDSLKLKSKLVRDDLKNITKTIWDIENNVIMKVLQVPNDLHSRTPEKEVVLSVFNEKINSGNDHIEIGKHLDCLEYIDKSSYYLKNDLALFELFVSQYFVDKFKSYGYIPTSNADFGRSVLIEGCTLKSFAPDVAFVLENTAQDKKDKVYLSGSASFIPFYGFHTKQIVKSSGLPVRYISSGRQYNPKPVCEFGGLYSVWQSSGVELFVATSEENSLIAEFDNTVQNITDLYKSLNIHFRVVNVPANELKPWESLRTNIQLYSPVNDSYVEVGNVSMIGDFVSKRLRAHSINESKTDFLNVITGTVIRIPVLIATLLETSTTDLCIPKVIKKEMAF